MMRGLLTLALTLLISGNLLAQDSIKVKTDSIRPFAVVEQMPSFPGGELEMTKFITQNLKIPAIAIEEGICSRLAARFVVQVDGSITDIEPIRISNEKIAKAIIRMIKEMPKWIPGKQNGVNVPVYYTISTNIHLKK